MKLAFFILLLTSSSLSFARLSLTTSGGVSLGVYEAGFLYYSMLLEQNLPKRRDDNLILTGASAGAINSFITSIERCSPMSNNPDESLFWKSWMPLNFDKFFIRGDSRANSLLQRDSIEEIFVNLEESWNSGLREDCVTTLGMTITRKNPYQLKEGNKLKYSRVQEYLVVKIRGRGRGKFPSVTNIHLKDSGSQMFLPFSSRGEGNFHLLKKALLASSSFPIAFEPISLDYCMVSEEGGQDCRGKSIEEDFFIDGGIFNNAPLDLAYSIAKNESDEENTTFIYFDPSIKNYPVTTEDDFSNIEQGLVKDLFKFVQNFITSSRSGQVSDFLRNHPKMNDKLYVLKGSMPLASEPLYGFFGFFEEDFRVFDFYMGMLDAKRMNANGYVAKNKFQFEKLNIHMKVLECLDAVFNSHHETISYCSSLSDEKFENFSALFQVSVESLFNNCSSVSPEVVVENKICKAAQKGFGPEMFDEKWSSDWRKKRNESQLSYIIRRLGHYNFLFKDLKVGRSSSDIALVKVKEKLSRAIESSAKNQPRDHRILLNQLASPAMNYLFYSPKQRINYFLVGNNTMNVGFSSVVSSSSLSNLYWRYGLGVMLTGVDYIYRPEVSSVGIVPYLGIYGEPTGLSTPLMQYRFGLRGGYQVSSKSDFKLGECSINSRSTTDFSSCSEVLVSGVANLTVFETIRSELAISVLPFRKSGRKRPTYISALVGIQF